MNLLRQYAERKKQEIMQKAASKLDGKVEVSKITMSGDAMGREYGGNPFISRTLGDVGIKPK